MTIENQRGHTASVLLLLLNSDDEFLAALVGRQEPRESGAVSSEKGEEGER